MAFAWARGGGPSPDRSSSAAPDGVNDSGHLSQQSSGSRNLIELMSEDVCRAFFETKWSYGGVKKLQQMGTGNQLS